MKLLTTNFLTCAVKTCKSSPLSFPLHFKDAVLERTEIDFNELFMRNILPRVNWDALMGTATELGVQALVPSRETVESLTESENGGEMNEEDKNGMDVTGEDEKKKKEHKEQMEEEVLKKLHTLLLETAVVEGKLVCGNCGFEYPIKEGVGNFLLPAHLV